MMNRDEYLTPSEMRLMNELKGKSRMEIDRILGEEEQWQTLIQVSQVTLKPMPW
jgi:hypothetical protein